MIQCKTSKHNISERVHHRNSPRKVKGKVETGHKDRHFTQDSAFKKVFNNR